MKKIVIKTVDGKTIRMTEKEYAEKCQRELKFHPDSFQLVQPEVDITRYGFYPNRFAGKSGSEINARREA